MATYFGLYYPFINFKNQGWLKLTALYWDGIKRIVPDGYALHDPDDVKALHDAGFVLDQSPAAAIDAVATPFGDLVKRHGDALAAKFGIAHAMDWQEDPHTRLYAPEGTDPRFAYVFGTKMSEQLVLDLHACGLVTARSVDPRWVGMHPRLADLYMLALAAKLTEDGTACPLTDETFDHIAVSGFTMERLAAALLEDHSLAASGGTAREIEQSMVSLAFGYVVPRNAAGLPVAAILELRKNHQEDRRHFQTEVAKLVGELAYLEHVRDPDEVARHVRNQLDKTIGPSLERLRKGLRSARIDILESAMAATFAVPAGVAMALTTLGVTLAPASLAAIGLGLGVWSILRKGSKEMTKALSPSAASYLYYVGEHVQAATVTQRIAADSRRFRLLPYV
jgi:hypothetical protein